MGVRIEADLRAANAGLRQRVAELEEQLLSSRSMARWLYARLLMADPTQTFALAENCPWLKDAARAAGGGE